MVFTNYIVDRGDERAILDDYMVLHEPPEYMLPEWEPLPPTDWESVEHDWTNDYDYPYDWDGYDEEEDYND